jgi:hypothetical protein
MPGNVSEELLAEIESFRAELRARAEKHDREMSTPNPLDVPSFDPSELELPQIRALVAQRYPQARLENRLARSRSDEQGM